MSFIKAMRDYYMRAGMDYREASRHAMADYDFFRNIFAGDEP
jgi:hypothetical protein